MVEGGLEKLFIVVLLGFFVEFGMMILGCIVIGVGLGVDGVGMLLLLLLFG